MSTLIQGAPEGDLSLSSACEYLVCGHLVDGLPTSAKPTFPPLQLESPRMFAPNAGRGSAQLCSGACVVVREASGQNSESRQPIPFGGGAVRSAGMIG